MDDPDATRAEDARLEGTILVVDDDEDVLASFWRFLNGRFPSLRLVTAESGPDALKVLDVVDPDVVISDYVMPGMSGLALLGLVHTRRPSAYRILLSGYATAATYADAVRVGTVDLLLQKPTDATDIARAIRHGLARSQERRAHPPPGLRARGEVLIVGEGPDLEEAIEEHFRAQTAEVRVRSADSASAALATLGQHPADVILADARLPDMEGDQFLAHAHRLLPQARTVLVAPRETGKDTAPPRDVDRLFLKPVDVARVARTIEKLLPHAPDAPPPEP